MNKLEHYLQSIDYSDKEEAVKRIKNDLELVIKKIEKYEINEVEILLTDKRFSSIMVEINNKIEVLKKLKETL